MVIFRVLAVITCFLIPNAMGFESERIKNEELLLKIFDASNLGSSTMQHYRSEAIRLYSSITKDNVDEIFGDLFISGNELITRAYLEALKTFTDKEISDLVVFYQSDFGKWYANKFREYNNVVSAYTNDALLSIDDEYIKRIIEVESQKQEKVTTNRQ
jgi:hypothetical protein